MPKKRNVRKLRLRPCNASYVAMHDAAASVVRGEWRATMKELAIVTTHQDGTINVDKSIPLNCA